MPRDKDDNRIVECAAESDSDVIVTGDKHLLEIDGFKGIKIQRVAEFLANP